MNLKSQKLVASYPVTGFQVRANTPNYPGFKTDLCGWVFLCLVL